MFRSLLIPIDLGPESERVFERAALLPLHALARLTLLHVVPKRLPREARARAEKDAQNALAAAARRLSRMIGKSAVVRQVVKTGVPAAEIARQARSVKAEVIVMGRGGGRAIRDVFLGSTAERVIRQGQLPVLVVRLPPRAPYTRPALAVDLDRAAGGILAVLLRMIPSRPRVQVIHAYEAPFHGFIYPSLSADEAEAYEEHYRKKARQQIARMLASALAEARVPPKDAPLWETWVRHGSPRTTIERGVRKTNADLLAMGTHGHAGIAHAFLGTVAGDVLRDVPCDVLVVPPS